MKVPVRINPGTRAPNMQRGYERALPVDLTPLAQAIGGVGENIAKQQQNRQLFDINKRVMDETNELTTLYATREAQAPLGATGFAEGINSELTTRHSALVEEYRQLGYDSGALSDLDLRLGSLRNSFNTKALGFQTKSYSALADKQFGDLGTSASQYAHNNPDAVHSALAEIEQGAELLRESGALDAITAEALIERERNVVIRGAGQGLALQRPEEVIRLLDPRALAEGNVTVESAISGWPGVAQNVGAALGLNPAEVAAVMSFETGGTFDPTIQGGDNNNYLGLIQFGKNEQVKYKITKDSTPEDWSTAITSFMRDRGFKPGMGIEDFYSTILTGSPGNYDRKDSNGTSVRNAIPRIMAQHLPKAQEWLGSGAAPVTSDPALMVGETLAPAAPPVQPVEPGNLPLRAYQQAQNDNGTVSTVRTISIGTDRGEVLIPTVIDGKVVSDTEAIGHYTETGENLGTFSSPEEATAYAKWLSEKHEGEAGRTGNPVLDLMNGPQRMEVLGLARQTANQNNAELRAAIDVATDNEINAIKQGQDYVGPRPTEAQFKSQYGQVVGAQKYAQVQAWRDAQPVIKNMPTTSVDALTASVKALQPTDTNDPAYTRKLEVYNAAKTAATQFIQARYENPAAYVAQHYPNIAQQMQNAQTSTDRSAAYGALANAYRQLGIPENLRLPIPKAQVAELAEQYDQLPSGQKLGQLDAWLKEMGPAGLFTNFAKQLNETSKSIKTDVFMYATLSGHPQFQTIMQNALDGETAMRLDPSQRPSPEALNRAYRAAFGNNLFGLNPDASNNYNAAAAALYVANGGKIEAQKGNLASPDIYKDALRQAVGGIKGDENTGIVNFQGTKRPATILPPGTNKAQFEGWLNRQTLVSLSSLANGLNPQTKTGANLTMQDIINEGVFVMKAPGVYEIQMKDGGVAYTALGQPFRIRLTPQAVRGR